MTPVEQAGEFGQDRVFECRNPKWWMLGFGVALASFALIPYLIDDLGRSGRVVLMRVVFSPLLFLVGAFIAWKSIGFFRTDALTVVVGSRFLQLPTIAGVDPDSNRVALEDIVKVSSLRQYEFRIGTQFETTAGKAHLLAAKMVTSTVEIQVTALVLQRSALRRAGVGSREELGAAEAYLAAREDGVAACGVVAAKSPSAPRSYTVVADVRALDAAVSGVASAPRGGHTVYVPAPVLTLLREASAGALPGVKPLHGVEAPLVPAG